MPSSIRPVIVTADLDRLQAFYTGVFGAREVQRFPEDGPVVYAGLAWADAELGLSAAPDVPAGEPGRVLLSIEVPDVDAVLGTVAELVGTTAESHDMPWGQRVAHVKDPDGNAVDLTQQL